MRMTKYIFFSGKGGVGKTSMASATAVKHAEEGKKTLIVTTDPASNLGDVFECEIGHKITSVTNNLFAMEIDPNRATEEYRERVLKPVRELMPEAVVKVLEEQLSSPCTDEIAAFDKFVDFMNSYDYDVIVFDTAPTGHTLRLLELPLDWKKAIELSEQGSGQTCIGPVQTLQESRAKYERAIEAMRSGGTEFIFVLQPDSVSIAETKRSIKELEKIGIKTDLVIVNGIIPREHCIDTFFKKRWEMQERYLKQVEGGFNLPLKKVELLDTEIRGLNILKKLGGMLYESPTIAYSRFQA